jgi:hypothetical protein
VQASVEQSFIARGTQEYLQNLRGPKINFDSKKSVFWGKIIFVKRVTD